ncbi:hypothetical protein NPIL_665971, partial [Nephila pilipes]
VSEKKANDISEATSTASLRLRSLGYKILPSGWPVCIVKGIGFYGLASS